MTNRRPAVAGMFYERSPEKLRSQIATLLEGEAAPAEPMRIRAAVVPHAGLMYSGHVAAALYRAAALPKRFIILCPNHTGAGHFAAINRAGTWRTPLGEIAIDTELADALMKRVPDLVEDDDAHVAEHSLEVQLPFLQHLVGDFTFVPICLGARRFNLAHEVGSAIAQVMKDHEDVMLLSSSDLNHYEDQATTLRKDQLAIDAVLARDPDRLWNTVEQKGVSMCGFIPTTAMLVAINALGATDVRLVKHATSGDISGDYARVVGYASIAVV